MLTLTRRGRRVAQDRGRGDGRGNAVRIGVAAGGKFQCTARRPTTASTPNGTQPILRDPAAYKASRRVPDREGFIIPYARVWVS
jgi:hypothetical protein